MKYEILRDSGFFLDLQWFCIVPNVMKTTNSLYVAKGRMHEGWSQTARCALPIEADCWC